MSVLITSIFESLQKTYIKFKLKILLKFENFLTEPKNVYRDL